MENIDFNNNNKFLNIATCDQNSNNPVLFHKQKYKRREEDLLESDDLDENNISIFSNIAANSNKAKRFKVFDSNRSSLFAMSLEEENMEEEATAPPAFKNDSNLFSFETQACSSLQQEAGCNCFNCNNSSDLDINKTAKDLNNNNNNNRQSEESAFESMKNALMCNKPVLVANSLNLVSNFSSERINYASNYANPNVCNTNTNSTLNFKSLFSDEVNKFISNPINPNTASNHDTVNPKKYEEEICFDEASFCSRYFSTSFSSSTSESSSQSSSSSSSTVSSASSSPSRSYSPIPNQLSSLFTKSMDIDLESAEERRMSEIRKYFLNYDIESDKPAQNTASAQSKTNFQFKPVVNCLIKYDLGSLNLVKKDVLLFLIERNQSNKIFAPFDQLAYTKLKKSSMFNGISYNHKNNYNYRSIKKLNESIKVINNNLFDKGYLKQNNMLPGCISTFLMPFFFDIFNASEMKTFKQDCVNMMLKLKKSYKAQIYLDNTSLISYLNENVVWNSLVIYKYRIKNDVENRMGYLNFYLTYIYVLMHLGTIIEFIDDQHLTKNDPVESFAKKYKQLGYILPDLLEAMILNGLFKHGDLVKFKKFFISKQFPLNEFQNSILNQSSQEQLKQLNCVSLYYNSKYDLLNNLKQVYLNNSLISLTAKSNNCFPLKLKNLCRIQLKEKLNSYDSVTINKLNIPKAIKDFLLFDDELGKFYNNKNLF